MNVTAHTIRVNRSLASGSGDTTVRFWDIFTETPLHTCKGHKHWILSIAWSPDGKKLASGCKNGQVQSPQCSTSHESRQSCVCVPSSLSRCRVVFLPFWPLPSVVLFLLPPPLSACLCVCLSRCVCGTRAQGFRWVTPSLDTSSGSPLSPGSLYTRE